MGDEIEDKTISKREDVSDADKERAKEEYGDVEFADEKNKKYPIGDESHVRAAWNYFSKPKNRAMYSAEEAAQIEKRIIAAWRKLIDKDGPPSAQEKALDLDALAKSFADGSITAEQYGEALNALKAGRRNSAADVERLKKIQAIIGELLSSEEAEAGEEGGEGGMMEEKAIDPDETVVAYGGEVKALETTGEGVKVGGYLIRFSTAKDTDLTGDYFDAKTDFDIDLPGKSTTYFHHGLDPKLKARRFDPVELKRDDFGIWAEGILHERDEYEKFLIELAKAGKLGFSSGTLSHLVQREPSGKAQHITYWPLGKDASYTHTPAESRNAVVPLKSLVTGAAATPPQAPTEPAGEPKPDQSTIGKETVQMFTDEDKKSIVELVSTAAADAATKAVAAYAEEIKKKEPAQVKMAYALDPHDNPYKAMDIKKSGTKTTYGGGFGEFLKDVALAAQPGNTPSAKLIAIREAAKASGNNEAIPSEGGWLVQPDHQDEIFKLAFDYGIFSSRCNRKTITAPNANGMTLNALDESSRATGSRFGGVQGYRLAEAATISGSKPKFRRMELRLKKYAVLAYATDELLQDTGLLEQVIMEAAPQELAFMTDDDILNGLGVGGPLGVLNSACLVSATAETGQSSATIVWENVLNMWKRRWARSTPNLAWFINQDVEEQLYTMNAPVGTGGLPVFLPPNGASASPWATLLGRPVIPTEFNATLGTVGDIVLGDFSQYQLIDKGGVQSATSMHVQFLTDEMVYRFIFRVDGQSLWATTLTPYKGTGNTQSPFVALATR